MSQNIKEQVKKEDYISLLEASKLCDYSQEYLSLRARQGKLKAVKLGRNWVTTKEWLNKYIKEVSVSVKSNYYNDTNSLYSVTNNFKGYVPKIKALLPLVLVICFLVFSLSIIEKIFPKELYSANKFVEKQTILFSEKYEQVVCNLSDTFYYKAKDISLGLASLEEVDNNIADSFISSIKRNGRELKKDISNTKENISYLLGVNISFVTKATATTFIDYSNWLSNQSGIVKTSKRAIDSLLSLNNNIKE